MLPKWLRPCARLVLCFLLQAGMFPDVAERLALGHLAKGDQMSALITGE